MKFRNLAHWAGGIVLAASLFAGGGSAMAQIASAPPALPPPALYNQRDHAGSNTIDSSDWVGHLSSISSQAADDFEVPNSTIWKISSVTAVGTIGGSSGSGVIDVLIRFYGNTAAGLPGTIINGQTIPSANITGLNTGVFVVPLNTIVSLGPGHYWFSAQGRQNCSATDGSCKHWSWTERTTETYDESAWQSPGGTYGPSCLSWGPRVSVCHQPGSSTGPDLLFELDGTSTVLSSHVMLPLIRR